MLKNKNNWFVLVTNPRNEKKVESKLNEIGIEAYCPVRTELRLWSDRKMKIKTPLLPSMLLVKVPNNLRNIVFDVPNVRRYLFWEGQPAVVREEEVSVLRKGSRSRILISEASKVYTRYKNRPKTFWYFRFYRNREVHLWKPMFRELFDSLGYLLKFQLS